MSSNEFLFTAAQIAGVLIGFANLASMFERNTIGEYERKLNKIRILIVTESGLGIVGLCLLPSVVSFFTDDEKLVFTVSSVVALIINSISTGFSVYRIKKTAPQVSSSQRVMVIFSILLMILPLLISLTIDISVRYKIALYCFSVYCTFLLMCFIFVRLFRSVIETVTNSN